MGEDMVRAEGGAAKRVTRLVGAQASIPCEVCGRPRAPRSDFWCSKRCRDRAYNLAHPVVRQRTLPLEPPPAPVPPVRDQRVPKRRLRALGTQSRRIWARLEVGPCTNAEMAMMFPPATAWRSRLSDLRWHLRWLWGLGDEEDPIPGYDCGDGLVWHWIEGA